MIVTYNICIYLSKNIYGLTTDYLSTQLLYLPIYQICFVIIIIFKYIVILKALNIYDGSHAYEMKYVQMRISMTTYLTYLIYYIYL